MAKTKIVPVGAVRIGAKDEIIIPRRISETLRLKQGDPVLIRLLGSHLELTLIPKDQLWFWTPEWQRKEREADEDIAHGRVKKSASVDGLLKDLSL